MDEHGKARQSCGIRRETYSRSGGLKSASRLPNLFVLTACLVAAFTGCANAEPTTVNDLVGNLAAYDGKRVAIAGTVAGKRESVSHEGNAYDTFWLCDGRCIRVFIFGEPEISDGQRLTVRGTFNTVKRVGRYRFTNEITADEGSL